MTKIALSAAAALFVLASGAMAADSPCKGLDNASCSALAGCAWQAQRVAGEASPKTGKPYVRSMKTHCRKGGSEKPAKLSKPAQST